MNSLNSLCLIGVPFMKNFVHFIKMENIRMPELKAFARERRLRGYFRLGKAKLIALLQDNEHQAQR